jgi:hypothetical protein
LKMTRSKLIARVMVANNIMHFWVVELLTG